MKNNKEIIKEARNESSKEFFNQREFLIAEEFRINKALNIQKKEFLEILNNWNDGEFTIDINLAIPKLIKHLESELHIKK